MNTFQKHPKDWIKFGGVLAICIVAVMGWHWTDTATKPFWWNFWVVAAVVCLIIIIGGWVYLNAKDKSKRQ